MSEYQEEYISITIGGMWELPGWDVRLDCHTSIECPHGIEIFEGHPRWDDGIFEEVPRQWIVPRVVEAFNEGGSCSTGICIDCILDNLRNDSRLGGIET